MRGDALICDVIPDFAALHPGYACFVRGEALRMNETRCHAHSSDATMVNASARSAGYVLCGNLMEEVEGR